jgi:hypothetical protein
MIINDNTFAFTAWLVRNTHVETETGLTERDGYDWYNYMWEKWLHNSDMGRTIINDMIKNNNINNKKLTVVEWLQETLRYNSVNIFKGSIEDQAKNLEQVFQQAKEMEYNIFFHWYFTGKNDVKENKSFRQRYNEKYGSNLEENKTNNMKVYRHKLTKTIMSEHDYNHLSSYEQSQMEATDRVTVAELDKMSRDISYWKVKTGDEGKISTGENNNPGTTTNMSNPRSELDTVTFTFTQETNCVDGPSNDIETLTVEAKSSLGIDGDGGAFFVLRTKQWALDNSNEIHEIIKRCERAIKAVV